MKADKTMAQIKRLQARINVLERILRQNDLLNKLADEYRQTQLTEQRLLSSPSARKGDA